LKGGGGGASKGGVCGGGGGGGGGGESTLRVTTFLFCNFFNKKFSNTSPVILQPHHVQNDGHK